MDMAAAAPPLSASYVCSVSISMQDTGHGVDAISSALALSLSWPLNSAADSGCVRDTHSETIKKLSRYCCAECGAKELFLYCWVSGTDWR